MVDFRRYGYLRVTGVFAVMTLALLTGVSRTHAQVVIDMPAPPSSNAQQTTQPAQTQPSTQTSTQKKSAAPHLGVLAINRYARARTAPRFTAPAGNHVLVTGGYRSIDGLYYRPFSVQLLPHHTFSGFHHPGSFFGFGGFHHPFFFHHGFHGFHGFHAHAH